MIIKSPYKDYYDFLTHLYGIDPKLVYVRKNIVCDDIEIQFAPIRYNHYKKPGPIYDIRWLCITGKRYLVLKLTEHHPDFYKTNDNRYHILDPVLHEDIYVSLVLTKTTNKKQWFHNKQLVKFYIGATDTNVDIIAKIIKQPVFLLEVVGWKKVKICSKIPVLCEIGGIPAMIPPEQMYQNLCYYISNVMVDSPDVQPPVTINDKDLIISKGFDTRQSFRHRK